MRISDWRSDVCPSVFLRGSYTRTKLAAEREVLDAIRDHALPAVIIRPGQIFGPGAERSTPNGVVSLPGRWVAVGSDRRTIPLVYVDDVVDAIVLAAETDPANGGVFHIDRKSTRLNSSHQCAHSLLALARK